MSLDPTRPPRPGEELDLEKLGPFLARKLPELEGPIAVEQFPKGHSNLTYLLRAGERAVVLRRPPHGARAIKSGHDVGREFRILSHLHPVYPKAPRPLLHCPEEESPIGVPFYVMERVTGVILRGRPPEGLDTGPAVMARVSRAFVDGLCELHAIDHAAAGLADLGRPEGYVARQVDGWSERYLKARTDELPDVDRVAAWLSENLPRESGAAVIHNDYKYDNLVLDPADPARILAVLDWEMATIGDPLADLGTALAYWLEPGDPEEMRTLGLGLTALEGNLDRAGVIARYAERSGRDVSGMLFHYVSALFKVAVIAQQLHFRWKQGFTKDERFAAMIVATRLLARMAAGAIASGRVSGS